MNGYASILNLFIDVPISSFHMGSKYTINLIGNYMIVSTKKEIHVAELGDFS